MEQPPSHRTYSTHYSIIQSTHRTFFSVTVLTASIGYILELAVRIAIMYPLHYYYYCINFHYLQRSKPRSFEGRHLDLRRSTHRSPKVYTSTSKVDPSISEGRNIDFRWSKHRSSKVDTSISDCRSIDLRRSKYRSSKVDTSISEGRNIDLRRSKHRSPKFEGHHRILFTTPLHRFLPPLLGQRTKVFFHGYSLYAHAQDMPRLYT